MKDWMDRARVAGLTLQVRACSKKLQTGKTRRKLAIGQLLLDGAEHVRTLLEKVAQLEGGQGQKPGNDIAGG